MGLFSLILFIQSDHYFKWTRYPDLPENNRKTIHTDGSGYYAYLPEWFLFENEKPFEHIGRISEKYQQPSFQQGLVLDTIKWLRTNKCFPGTAISTVPSFLITCAVYKLTGNDPDGYSWGFELMLAINSILFWLAGCIAIVLLMKYWNISNWWIAVVLGIITFATPVNFYTVYFPSFSHVCSFLWISWFLYISAKWSVEKKNSQFIVLCFLIGMIFLVRPSNILVALMVPFLFKSVKDFLGTLYKILSNPKVFFWGLFILFCAVFTQYFNVYWQIGEWKLNLYGNEGFDFLLNPQVFNILFSYKKGLFIYSPAILIAFLAIFSSWRHDRFKSIGWITTIVSFIYITSAWWCWWYGGGFGMRPFVDITLISFIPIILVFKYSRQFLKWSFVVMFIPTVYAYQIFQFQYANDILHYELIDKETFWQVFLETEERFMWAAAFEDDKLPKKDLEFRKTMYLNAETLKFDSKRINSHSVEYKNNEQPDVKLVVLSDAKMNFARIGVLAKFEIELFDQKSNPSIVISYLKNGQLIKQQIAYTGYRVDDLRKKEYLEIPFYPGLKYSEIDSMLIEFGKGVIPTKYSNLSVEVLGFGE